MLRDGACFAEQRAEAFAEGIREARMVPESRYRMTSKESAFLLIGIGFREGVFGRFRSRSEFKREFETVFPKCRIPDSTFHRTWRRLELQSIT